KIVSASSYSVRSTAARNAPPAREYLHASPATAAAQSETQISGDTNPRETPLAAPAPPDSDALRQSLAHPRESAYPRPRAPPRPLPARAAASPASQSAYRQSRREKASRRQPARISRCAVPQLP